MSFLTTQERTVLSSADILINLGQDVFKDDRKVSQKLRDEPFGLRPFGKPVSFAKEKIPKVTYVTSSWGRLLIRW